MSFYSANLGLGPIRNWGNLFKQIDYIVFGDIYIIQAMSHLLSIITHDLILSYLRDVIDDLDRTQGGIITPRGDWRRWSFDFRRALVQNPGAQKDCEDSRNESRKTRGGEPSSSSYLIPFDSLYPHVDLKGPQLIQTLHKTETALMMMCTLILVRFERCWETWWFPVGTAFIAHCVCAMGRNTRSHSKALYCFETVVRWGHWIM